MKTALSFFVILCCNYSFSQQTPTDFHFWIGTWEGTWDEGLGEKGKAVNTVSLILNEQAIQENFEITEGSSKGFKGTSISAYIPKMQTWKQNWFDSQGAYFDFTAEVIGKQKMFVTQVTEKDGKKHQQRMVFHDIENNSFTWDWEQTQDGGKTWQLTWRIFYKRI